MSDSYETKLNPQQEAGFWGWLDKMHTAGKIGAGDYRFYKSNGYGYDYDFRNAYLQGLQPGKDGHWSDVGKKPNHPTFSTFSKYSQTPGARPGTWDGDTYVPYREPAKKGAPQDYTPPRVWTPGSVSQVPLVVNGQPIKPDKDNGLTQPRNAGLFKILKRMSDIRNELMEPTTQINTTGSNG